ncbi:hypothetical protein FV242_31245 [Methylobacterium sp. WL64]|uniref:metallophosphoesterase family protein n=1 Tax=Methylobacterium sp. WL64 TaxID=2603894 RepID=UPI0011C97A60|nr:metallophosphoesterase [Methylobacterium sp. WL64]TXM97563.1 hypothetical protein FV242_31245 [Methylobacterium sp. WL64]
MPVNRTLRFLQLSDIHFGQERPEELPRHNDVREELLRDCRQAVAQGLVGGPATAILVTGDIAYAGKEEQYKVAGEWLDRVAAAVGCGEREVRLIPGNHDVDVARLGYLGKQAQKHLRTLAPAVCAGELSQALSDPNSPLIEKLDSYFSFAEAYECAPKNISMPFHTKDYELAGGKAIRIVGLCSVLISDLDDSEGGMFMGAAQYSIPRDDAVEQVYLLHHPIGWFKDRVNARPYIAQRARVFMTGHEHLANFTVSENSKFEHLHLAAGALNPDALSEVYNYSYNWIELSWISDSDRAILNVRVYPRAWNPTTTSFAGDYQRTGDIVYRDFRLDCGPAIHVLEEHPEHLLGESSAQEEPSNKTVTSGIDLSTAKPREGTTTEEAMKPPASHVASAIDERPMEVLKFLFWRHLDRQTRQDILRQLNLLPSSNTLVPHPFEVAAFERAFGNTVKSKELWDAAMTAIPPAHQRKNPF